MQFHYTHVAQKWGGTFHIMSPAAQKVKVNVPMSPRELHPWQKVIVIQSIDINIIFKY